MRDASWDAWRRCALFDGRFLPSYGPVARDEIDPLATTTDTAGVRLGLRAGATWREIGGLVEDEAGLATSPGLTLDIAPELTATRGRWWAAVAPRLVGRPIAGGRAPADALLFSGWPDATTLPLTGEARAADPAWIIDVPYAVVGVRLGRWAVSAGWAPCSVGPGLGGGLTASTTAPSYPALVARRVRPFAWSGFLKPVAPAQLLVRIGATSRQTVAFDDPAGPQTSTERPILLQWLVGWNHTSWWRSTLTQSALAAARGEGSVWLDLPEVGLPGGGTTWTELERGPVTDRILSVMTEARFRDAPWPWLPSRAGRVWLEYGGEDAIAEGVPELSAPGTVVGCEFLDDRGDLAFEFRETRHPKVLWYSHSGFAEGFSHDGWVLGLPTGGGAQTWHVLGRWRPGGATSDAWTLDARHTTWADNVALPGTAKRATVTLGWRRGRLQAEAGGVYEDVRGPDGETVVDRFVTSRVVIGI